MSGRKTKHEIPFPETESKGRPQWKWVERVIGLKVGWGFGSRFCEGCARVRWGVRWRVVSHCGL